MNNYRLTLTHNEYRPNVNTTINQVVVIKAKDIEEAWERSLSYISSNTTYIMLRYIEGDK